MKRILLLELCFLFLATTFQGDRLIGWVQQTIPTNAPVVDLQFLDSLTGFIVSSKSTPDSAFLLKTTDGGNNWITVVKDQLILTSINFPSRQTGYCVGLNIPNAMAIVLKTTNSGNNWNVVSTLPSNILDDVCFANNDTGWVCDHTGLLGGLWRTTNGGLNWQKQMSSSNGPSKIFFVNSNTGWVIGSANYDLYKTTNSGVNWFLQTNISTLLDVFFASQDTGWAIGGNGNGIMRTTNGGDNWNNLNNPVIWAKSKLFFINNKMGWVGSASSKIVATKDGIIWGNQTTPGYEHYNVSFTDSLHGWAAYTGLVNTTDGGGIIVGTNSISSEIPKDCELGQNYPNPFNSSSKFKIKIAKLSNAKVVVYDIQGREVQTIVNENLNPGIYEYNFNGNNLASGIYFYKLFIDNKPIDTKKLSLIK